MHECGIRYGFIANTKHGTPLLLNYICGSRNFQPRYRHKCRGLIHPHTIQCLSHVPSNKVGLYFSWEVFCHLSLKQQELGSGWLVFSLRDRHDRNCTLSRVKNSNHWALPPPNSPPPGRLFILSDQRPWLVLTLTLISLLIVCDWGMNPAQTLNQTKTFWSRCLVAILTSLLHCAL